MASPGHARLAPSSAHVWLTCPGSVELTEHVLSLGVGTSSAASDQGTICHALLEQYIKHSIRPAACHNFKAGTPEDPCEGVVTEEMVGWVNLVIEWIDTYVAEHSGCRVFSEEKARVGEQFGCPDDLWGTVDVVILNDVENELVILDAKFGYVEVKVNRQETIEDLLSEEDEETVYNEQLSLYAIGVQGRYGWAYGKIRLVIAQPKSMAQGVRPIREAIIAVKTLEEIHEDFKPRVKDALTPGAPLVVTEDACRWCKAGGVCPALQERALQMANTDIFEPKKLSEEQFLYILERAEIVRIALRRIEFHAKQLLELGRQIPGFKLVERDKHRVFKDPDGARAALEMLGFDEADFVEKKLRTPAQIEKLVGKKTAKLLAHYIEKPDGDSVLVRESDPRPAVKGDFEVFAEVEEGGVSEGSAKASYVCYACQEPATVQPPDQRGATHPVFCAAHGAEPLKVRVRYFLEWHQKLKTLAGSVTVEGESIL